MKLKLLVFSSLLFVTHKSSAMDPVQNQQDLIEEYLASEDPRFLPSEIIDICSFDAIDIQSARKIVAALDVKNKEIHAWFKRSCSQEAPDALRAIKIHLALSLNNAIKKQAYENFSKDSTSLRFLDRIRDCGQETALHRAVREKNIEVAQLLLAASDDLLDAKNFLRQTALERAIDNGDIEMTKLLLAHYDEPIKQLLIPSHARGYSSLHVAADRGKVSMIKFLLTTAGKYIEILFMQYSRDGFALDIARSNKREKAYRFLLDVQEALQERNPERLQALLSQDDV